MIDQEILVIIAAANPSLETLSTRTSLTTDLDIRIKEVCPRFKATSAEVSFGRRSRSMYATVCWHAGHA